MPVTVTGRARGLNARGFPGPTTRRRAHAHAHAHRDERERERVRGTNVDVVAVDVDALAVPTPPTWKALVRTLWAALDSDDSSLLDDSSNSSNSSRILEAMIASLHDNGVGPISARLGLSLATAVHRLGMTRAVFLSSRHALSIPYRRMSFVELVRMASMLAAANVTEVGLLDALSVGIGRGALDGLRADMLVVLLQSMVGVNWQGTREEKGRVTAAAVRSRVHLDAGAAVGLLHVLTRDAGDRKSVV